VINIIKTAAGTSVNTDRYLDNQSFIFILMKIIFL
jgi:hypothetical protein